MPCDVRRPGGSSRKPQQTPRLSWRWRLQYLDAMKAKPSITVSEARPALTIATHNVGDSHARTVPVSRTVRVYEGESWPDVFVLQELRSQGHLIALHRAFCERSGRAYAYDYSGRIGVGVLAVGELAGRRELVLPSDRGWYGAFEVLVRPGRAGDDVVPGSSSRGVRVVGVHLEPVRKSRDRHGFSAARGLVVQLAEELFRQTPRSRGVAAIHDWVSAGRRGSRDPVVIAGDFNTVGASTALRFMRRHYHDALAATPDARTGTYWKIRGPHPRIDFIFLSRDLEATGGRVVRRQAGDHYPVVASVRTT